MPHCKPLPRRRRQAQSPSDRQAALSAPLALLLLVLMAVTPTLAADEQQNSSPQTPAPPITLRPMPVEGRTSRYEFSSQRDQLVTMRGMGRNESVTTRMMVSGNCTWSVQRVRADGSSTCEMTFDWITIDLTMPDGSVQSCDSRLSKGDNDSVHRLIRAMAGVAVKCEVNSDGSVRRASGIDEIKQRAGEGIKPPDELDFIESASDLATLPFAPATIEVGRSWDGTFEWNHDMGKLQQSLRYTLAGVEEIEGIPIATVTAVGKSKLTPDQAKLPQGGPRIDVRLLDGKVQTQVIFDLNRHEAVGRHSHESRQIEMTIRLPQGTVTRTLDETIQSQTLRIAEE
jgi:hypothetical protein